MDVYKIDVTGNDLLKKKYGIIVLYNNKHAYAHKFSSPIQTEIRNNFNQKKYGIDKKVLKPKVYSAILCIILRQISKENQTETKEFELHICNDFDGHQNNIIQLIKEHSKSILLFEDIGPDNYHFRKHPKKSKIQELALQLNSNNWTSINRVNIDGNELHNLIAKNKLKKKRW